jgi:hypothetical protein
MRIKGVLVATLVLLLLAGVAGAQDEKKSVRLDTGKRTVKLPQQGPILISPACGVELHNFPRVINMSWKPVAGANGYQVEIDCLHCRQVGKWDSEVGPPTFVPGVTGTTATYTFSGDNQGRWRVRATWTATTPQTSAIQAGPWSKWCGFSFKTGGQSGEPPVGKPDITSKKGIIIGGDIGGVGGKFVPWGGSVVLTEADALHGSPNYECAFNLSYDMVNVNGVPTGTPFENHVKMEDKLVSKQSALSLAAGEVRQINTQAYLGTGSHILSLWLDAASNVPESNEGNNAFRIKYKLEGKCYKPYP